MEKYIKSINSLNKVFLDSRFASERDRFSESDIFWASKKGNKLPHIDIKKGEVYQFEFGKNYVPEMSYEHRGLVIGRSGKLIYVLPICSFNEDIEDHRNAYHPENNPDSLSPFYSLKASDYAFLTRDSVLKLDDLRTVSVLRIKYKQKEGRIPPNEDVYKNIVDLVFRRYFPDRYYLMSEMKTKNDSMEDEVSALKQSILDLECTISNKDIQIEELELKNSELKSKIAGLKKRLYPKKK